MAQTTVSQTIKGRNWISSKMFPTLVTEFERTSFPNIKTVQNIMTHYLIPGTEAKNNCIVVPIFLVSNISESKLFSSMFMDSFGSQIPF